VTLDWIPDRLVRFATVVGSTVAAAAILMVAMTVADQLGYGAEGGLVVVAFVATDLLVFSWLVRRFEITPPRAFREVDQ
jgi:hypothetical protein